MSLEQLSAEWLAAKETERQAVEFRRQCEDRLLSLIGIVDGFEGTQTAEAPGYKIKMVGRMNRKVDGDKLQEIAAEHGLTEHLHDLFRWKPEINAKTWKSAAEEITRPLLGAITTTPGRVSFTITQE